jgi:3-isopropylmalate/(R)-2-methylmalate dehydratase small subunit
MAVELTEDAVGRIFTPVGQHPGLRAAADLSSQKITLHAEEEIFFGFDADGASKERLVKGLDDIDISLAREADITRFEQTRIPSATF